MNAGKKRKGSVPLIALEKALVLNRELSYGARCLYLVLRSLEQPNGCFPSMDNIAYYMNASTPTVRKYMDELVSAGWVERKRRGLGMTNVYTLPEMPHSPEVQK